MPKFIPISEGKQQISELVRDSDEEDVVFTRHGRPAAVLLSARRHRELVQHLDDLEDRLSVHEADRDDTLPWEKVKAELDDAARKAS